MQYTAQVRPVEFVGHIIPDLLQLCMHSPDEAADLQHLNIGCQSLYMSGMIVWCGSDN